MTRPMNGLTQGEGAAPPHRPGSGHESATVKTSVSDTREKGLTCTSDSKSPLHVGCEVTPRSQGHQCSGPSASPTPRRLALKRLSGDTGGPVRCCPAPPRAPGGALLCPFHLPWRTTSPFCEASCATVRSPAWQLDPDGRPRSEQGTAASGQEGGRVLLRTCHD